MLLEWKTYSYFIKLGKTDMRKNAHTLSMLVESEMEMNPFEKNVYLFCSGTRKILKVIVWDGNGFWEMTKRLESRGTFAWPSTREEALEVTLEEIRLMLKGADPWRVLPVENPQKVS
ncbi:MAG: IS66 family insertion sequence element accessory protein TnpB [Sphaerochaetaceae bacterium]|jgi:transposase|nr:IS66 family insertion sequence element accessory protein TnpB [Sphaerochaetaceae bacterium]